MSLFTYFILTNFFFGISGSILGTEIDRTPSLKLADTFSPSNKSPSSKDLLNEEDNATVLRRELKASSFKRSFELGDLLDGDNISANFKDGVLSISVPKVEPEKPKKHTVKIG